MTPRSLGVARAGTHSNMPDWSDTYFEIIGEVSAIETIATGHSVRRLKSLRKRYGGHRWRKRKGTATVRLADGSIRRAEVHWYEAHGVGRKGWKVKRLLD